MNQQLLKPVMLWSNVALAIYALVVYYKPELADVVSTEMILGIAAAVNSVLLGVEKYQAAS